MANNMDSMQRMRAAHQDMKDKDAIRHPVSGETMELDEHDRSIADIFADSKTQNEYLKFLYQQNDADAKDIADSLSNNTPLTKKQDTFLEKNRKSFNLLSAHIEKIQEGLTPKEIEYIGRIDKRIGEVIGKIGSEEAAALLGVEMRRMAFDDTKRFNKIANGMQKLHEIETGDTARITAENVGRELERYGITEGDYFKATLGGLTPDTRRNLDAAVAEQFGSFRKALDWAFGGRLSRSAGGKLYANFAEQQKLLAECDSHMKTIGRVLQGTLTPEVNAAIQKRMLDQTPIGDSDKSNVRTIGDLKNVRDSFDPSAIKADFERRLQTALAEESGRVLTGRRRGGSLDPHEQALVEDRTREAVATDYADRVKQYQGSGLLRFFLDLLFRPGGASLDKAAIKRML